MDSLLRKALPMYEQLKRIAGCEVCGSTTLREILDLGMHPMCDDLVAIGDTRRCVEYPIDILYCETCRTAHQRYQIPKRLLFPSTYHYRARHTADVLNGMRQLVSACATLPGGLRERKVLDIGCNDGSLLSIFAEAGAQTFGIEPTGAAHDAIAAGHAVDIGFLDEDLAERFVSRHGQPDIITFTNVFAHIEDLQEVLRSLRILLGATTALVIENHYLGAVIERHQFDTFYHEHPRTYSYTSFTHIARALGLQVSRVEFPARYGGNIRVLMTRAGSAEIADDRGALAQREQDFGSGLAQLARSVARWQQSRRPALLAEIARHGPLPAKAFPGRAAILIRLLELDETHLSATYEKPASAKIGHYIPGTRIPILSDDEFVADGRPLLNLAWHIPDEIRSYMQQRGYTGQIIDILTPDGF